LRQSFQVSVNWTTIDDISFELEVTIGGFGGFRDGGFNSLSG
jgi:hypothetical protein